MPTGKVKVAGSFVEIGAANLGATAFMQTVLDDPDAATARATLGAAVTTKIYNPTATDVATSSTSLTDIDATNMVVTFTVPATGKVLITLTGMGYGGASASALMWGLREGSSDIAGPVYANESTAQVAITKTFLVTGLTPGASKTYKWAHAKSNATAGAGTRYGGVYGAALMVVNDAP